MEANQKARTKRLLRNQVLTVREALSHTKWEQASRAIFANVLELKEYRLAKRILCYVNYKRETETLPFLQHSLALGKEVYCPAVTGKEMEFYQILQLSELQPGFHGILEPQKRQERLFYPVKQPGALMLMPGVVFDKSHHRIGYGGGYYDRYLKKYRNIDTIALAFSFQVKEQIPFEEHDICPKRIVTELGSL